MAPLLSVHSSDLAEATDDAAGDALLHAAWLEGDERAGTQLLSRVQPALRRYLQRKAPSQSEDIFQATLERAHRVRAKYTGQGRFEGFMILVARNVLRESRRRASSRPASTASPSRVEGEAPEGESPARAAESEQLRARLRECIAQLPCEQREVVDAYFHQGLRVPEIAAQLGVPQGTVKSRKAAALRKIRDQLAASGATRRQIRLTLAASRIAGNGG